MPKLRQQARRAGGFFWRKLPWHGKLILPLAALALLLYALGQILAMLGVPI